MLLIGTNITRINPPTKSASEEDDAIGAGLVNT